MKTGLRITDYGPTLNFWWRGRLATLVFNVKGQGYFWTPFYKKYYTSTNFSWWRIFYTIDNFKSA